METWKIVTITLTVISLLWNVGNTIYTKISNSRNTRRLVNLEEFRSRVRDPLEDVLRRTEAVLREVSQISRHADFPSAFEDDLIRKNKELMRCIFEIQDRLTDADESRFSVDFNWLDLYDPMEDDIMQSMNGLLAKDAEDSSRAEFAMGCRTSFRRFKKTVVAKIESQVAALSA